MLRTDPELLEVRFNGEWLDMPMEELFALARIPTVAQILERDDFAKRYRAGEPISILELLYPLLQGYDSVAIDADVELGGTDQTFNLLLGRDIQRAYGKPEQAVLTMPILAGTDGVGEDVQVAGQPHRRHRGARGAVRQDPAASPTRRCRRGSRCWRSTSRRPARRRATPSARSRARSWRGSTRPRRRAAAEEHFDRVHIDHGVPDDVEVLRLPAGSAHLPGRARRRVRRVALGGAAAADRATASRSTASPSRSSTSMRRAARRPVLQVGKRQFRRVEVG